MGISCSFGITKQKIEDIIGKDTISNLTEAECISTITLMMTNMNLPQEELMSKKYESDIKREILRQRKIAEKEKTKRRGKDALDILKKEGITLDNSLIDDLLSKAKPGNPYHQLFKQIVGILRNNDIPINIEIDSSLQSIAARKQDGFKTATIRFNPSLLLEYLMTDDRNNIKGNLMKVLTHELVHSVTAEILNYHPSWSKIKGFNEAQTEFTTNTWNLYLQCKEQLKGTEWYGLTNAKEFIAEALTNREFQIVLSKIKIDKKENAFKRFINYITNLFNKVFKAQGIELKNSALEEIMSISQEYFNAANKDLRGGIDDYTGSSDYFDKAPTSNPFNITKINEDKRKQYAEDSGISIHHIESPTDQDMEDYSPTEIVIVTKKGNRIQVAPGAGFQDLSKESKTTDIRSIIGINYLLENYLLANPSEVKKFGGSVLSSSAKDLYGNNYDASKDHFQQNYVSYIVKKSALRKEDLKKQREEEAKKKLEEAIESAKAERPVSPLDAIDPNSVPIDTLSNAFPNVSERIAAVSFVSDYFSLVLGKTLNDFKQSLIDNEEAYRESLGDEVYDRISAGLNKGTEAQQRLFLLGLNVGSKPLPLQIFDNIKSLIDDFKNTEDIEQLVYNYFLNKEDDSINTDSYLGREFYYEAQQRGWNYKNIKEKAIFRVRYLKGYFTKHFTNENVFDALIKEAAFDIEFNENLRLDTTGNVSESQEEITDKEQDVQNELENPNKEGYMIKYKLLNPIDTISVKFKNKLAHIYKINTNTKRANDIEYYFNSLGIRVKLNPMVAYYIVLQEFQNISSEEELDNMFETAVNNYPWLQELKDNVVFNPYNPTAFDIDFRKEFFRSCKSFTTFAIIGNNGRLTYKNRDNKSSTFLEQVTKNYEGHFVIGNNSIYNEDGTRNAGNVASLYHLLIKKDKKEDISKVPFAYVNGILDRKNSTPQNLAVVLQILRGEHPKYPKISLESLLNNLGVDTNDVNLEALIPNIEAFEVQEDGMLSEDFTVDFIEEADDHNMTPVEYFNSLFTKDMKNRIKNILEMAIIITRPTLGYQAKDNLVKKFQNAYLAIGSALTIASEGYSQNVFRFAGNTMNSYTAYDYITRMTNLLQKVDSKEAIERGTQWLQENFGQYDFFRNQKTGEWYNTWAQQLYEEGDFGDYSIRKNFKILNLLSFKGDEDESHSVGKTDTESLIDGFIMAFFQGNTDSHGTTYGWYRNPLFSDTAASVLFKGVRYTGKDYKQKILYNLSKVLRQEIERIIDVRNNRNKNIRRIEFYNEGKTNGAKFNFFPALNSKLDEVINTYSGFTSLNSVEFKEKSQNYLINLLADIIEGPINPITGLREGGKLQEFLNSIDEKRRNTILQNYTNLGKSKDSNSSEDIIWDEEDAKEKKELKKQQKEDIEKLLIEFFYNDYFAQSQIIQLLGGDLAYYKNFRDFIKRNKQAYAAGDRVYGYEMDEQGHNKGKIMEHSLYIEDSFRVSNSYEEIKELLESNVGTSPLTKDIILGTLKAYTNICTTDGQSFRTAKGMKKVLEAMGGKWTKDMDEAYYRMTVEHRLDLKDFFAIWNNIKPFLFSHESIKVGGRNEKVVTQHKNSEYLLTSMFGIVGSALNTSPQLRALQKFMEDYDIDVVHFHSVVKEGYSESTNISYSKSRFNALQKKGLQVNGYNISTDSITDYFYDLDKLLKEGKISQEQYNNAVNLVDFENSEKGYLDCYSQIGLDVLKKDGEQWVLNPDKLHIVPLSDYMVVQPSGDHLTEDDLMALFGSQLRNIIPADLPEDFTITVNIGGVKKTLNREEAVKYYNTLIVDQLLDSFSKIKDEYSNIEKLQASLLAQMRNNPKYGSDVEAALQLNETRTAFKIPFNNPNLTNKIEELLLSAFKNAIQKQKINGGNIVLVSNFGFSNNLKIKYKKDAKGNKCIDYIPCYMPAYKRSIIQDVLVEHVDPESGETWWSIDYNRIKGNEELLRIIGYRIPTENKCSIFNLRIEGFLPISAGTAMILPSDIITMSGTDFDIDKLFLMLKNFRREVVDANYIKGITNYLYKLYNSESSDEEYKSSLKSLIDKLRRKTGLTQEEIDFYSEKYEDFEEYLDINPIPDKMPYYRAYSPRITKGMSIEDISLLKGYSTKDRKKIRDNMLIDFIREILSSSAGSQLSLLPSSYKNVKHASREQRIMKDPKALQKFYDAHKKEIAAHSFLYVLDKYGRDYKDATIDDGINALESFYDKEATVDDPLSIIDYAKNHRNLMDGNDLIGMFAVSSSSHYKFQFINNGRGLSIHPESQFNIKLLGKPIVTVTNIDPVISPLTGKRIGDDAKEFQSASPDNGKDPTLGDLNANGKTIARVAFLTRIGCDPQTVGILNTCDDLIAHIKELKVQDADITEGYKHWKDFEGNIEEIVEMIVNFRLHKPINKTQAGMFLGWMQNIQNLSLLLNQSTDISRCDSPNGALAISTAEVTQQRMKAQAFINTVTKKVGDTLIANPSSPIQGFEQFIDIDLDATTDNDIREKFLSKAVPRMQAFYTLGLTSAYSLLGKYNLLPQFTTSVQQAIQLLSNLTGNPLTSSKAVKELRMFYSELTMYLLSGADSRFGSDSKDIMEKRNYYIHDFPIKFKLFLEEKDKWGNYKHLNVRNMTIIKSMSTNTKSGITFNNVGKVSPKSRKYFSEELTQLLASKDPEVVQFAEDLFNYAYYYCGFNFGHSNYGIFLSNAFYENMPRYLNVLKSRNKQLLESKAIDDYLKNYVLQFLMNNPRYVKNLNKKFLKYFKFYEDENGNAIMQLEDANGLAAISTKYDKSNIPIIMIRNGKYSGMYVLASNSLDSEPMYIRKPYNGLRTPFYDSTKTIAEIDYTNLKDFGDTSNVSKVREALGKDNIEEAAVPQTDAEELADKVLTFDDNTNDKADNITDSISDKKANEIEQLEGSTNNYYSTIEEDSENSNNRDNITAVPEEVDDSLYIPEENDSLFIPEEVDNSNSNTKQNLDDFEAPVEDEENNICKK